MRHVQFDIELAITELDAHEQEWLRGLLPEGYCIEDRTDVGYGLVIRSTQSGNAVELGEKFEAFVRPLLTLSTDIEGRGCVLRVAVFSSLASTTTTWTSGMQKALGQLSCDLETSVYPVGDDTD